MQEVLYSPVLLFLFVSLFWWWEIAKGVEENVLQIAKQL